MKKNTILWGVLILLILSSTVIYADPGAITAEDYYEFYAHDYESLNMAGALSNINLAISIDDNNAKYHSAKASILRSLERFDEALKSYDKAIKLDSINSYYYFSKADCLELLKRYDEALVCYDKAIELEPATAIYWINKGDLLILLGKYEEAIECLDESIMMSPGLAQAYCSKGYALYLQGKYAEAISYLDKAAAGYRNYTKAYEYKVLVYIKMGDAINANKNQAIVHRCRGIDAFYAEDFTNASSELEKALALDSTDAPSYYWKAELMRRKSQYMEAISYYNEALALDNGLVDAYLNKGMALVQTSKYSEAITCFDEVIVLVEDYRASHMKAYCLGRLNKIEEASQNYTIAFDMLQYDTPSLSDIGDLYMNSGYTSVASAYYLAGTELGATNSTDFYYLGNCFLKLGKYGEALMAFDSAIKIDPYNAQAYNGKGDLLMLQNEDENAMTYFDKALGLNPYNVDYQISKGLLLCKQNRCNEAMENFEKAVEYGCQYDKAYYFKAGCNAKMGNVREAIIDIKQAISMNRYNIELIKSDKRFDDIRETEEFLKLIGE